MFSLYFISLYQCLDKVQQCYILQNSTLVQRVVRQGMVLFYTYICFDTYSKLSRYEVSTSLVLIHIYEEEKNDDNARNFLSSLHTFISRV